MNRRTAALLLCATTLGGSLLFTGCAAGASSEQATTAPSAAASSAPATSPTSDGTEVARPSKDEVVAGLTKFYESHEGLTSEQSKTFATCMVDQMYDRARTKTLIAMQSGDAKGADPSDTGLVAAAGFKCSPN
mgnify:CR=1 FL=1